MKTLLISFRLFIVLTILTGVAYPLFVMGIGHLFFRHETEGSLYRIGNVVVGSELIAQSFSNPKYFWPRPSVNKYDGLNSGASNQAVGSTDLIKAVKTRESQGAVHEMRFASASGLDPHISIEAAQSQLNRIAQARQLNETQTAELEKILLRSVETRQLGILGEPRVNVLKLNVVIDKTL